MGTRIPAQWLVLLLPLVIAFPSGAAAEALEAAHVEGAPTMDGKIQDPYWADAAAYSLQADGILDRTVSRTMDVRLAHNGTHLFIALEYTPENDTHPDDFVRVTLAAAGRLDGAQHGWNADTSRPYVDRHWTGSTWADDTSATCATDGTGARGTSSGSWQWELIRPLSGDDCDLDLTAGEPLRLRIEVRENLPFLHPTTGQQYGDNFRWPQGSDGRGDASSTWGSATIATMAGPTTGGGSSGGGAPGDDATSDRDDTSADTTDGAASTGSPAPDGATGADGDDGAAGSTQAGEAPLPLVVVLVAFLLATLRAKKRT